MNPSLAFESEIFGRFALIAGALLAGAGIVLTLIRLIARKRLAPVWSTYRSWLVMAPLVFGCILAGRVVTILGVTLLAVWGLFEFARATGLGLERRQSAAVYLAAGLTAVASLMGDPFTGGPGWLGLFLAMPVLGTALILLVPILTDRTQGKLKSTAVSVLGFIYIGWMFAHLGYLANTSNPYGYLLYILVAVELNDVAAFTCGRLFGRRRLRPEISPGKTWGGAIGAVVFSAVLAQAMSFALPEFSRFELAGAGLIVGIGGQLGDLTMSYFKRDLGVKDMGTALPGHGGILDRIDSLIYTAPLFFHFTRWVEAGA